MKICPVCNDSFADELNFCDIDGVRLAREGSPEERNKWWSLLGAGLLIGGLVITAASIIFLPKVRVNSPTVSSEPQQSPAPPQTPSAESAANVPAQAASAEPESVAADAAAPELKKKEKPIDNANASGPAPNPKAAALAAEGVDKASPSAENTPPSAKKPELPPAAKAVDLRSGEPSSRPAQTAADPKKDHQPQPASAKNGEKDSADKKKNDEKDKKKGGFLKVFKKIFGKD